MRFVVFLVLIPFPKVVWDSLAKIRKGIHLPEKSLITILGESSSFKAFFFEKERGLGHSVDWFLNVSVSAEIPLNQPEIAEAYLEPCQISKMEPFERIVNKRQQLTILAKNPKLNVWAGCEYASDSCFSGQ